MSRIIGKLMIGTLLLLAIAFVGFQVWRSLFANLSTQPAEVVVVNQRVTARGIAVREELLLEGVQGNLGYLFTDGEHVSKNAPVARQVENRSEISDQMRRDTLEQELEGLVALSGAGEAVILSSDTITQRVYSDIDAMAKGAAVGKLSGAQQIKQSIVSQLNRRELTTGRESGFEAEKARLEQELLTLGTSSLSDENAILAPKPGYFTKTVDSLESVLTPETMRTMPISELEKLTVAPQKREDGYVGKLITAHRWYFAALLPEEELPKFQEGKKAELDFGISGQKPLIGTIDEVRHTEGEQQGLVVFECDEMSEALSNMRAHKVDISLSEISGYKLPRSSKRYYNDQLGVYVLETAAMHFKPAEVIYEDEREDYVVYSDSFGGKNGIQRFDNVIVEGRGLYDKKPVKQ